MPLWYGGKPWLKSAARIKKGAPVYFHHTPHQCGDSAEEWTGQGQTTHSCAEQHHPPGCRHPSNTNFNPSNEGLFKAGPSLKWVNQLKARGCPTFASNHCVRKGDHALRLNKHPTFQRKSPI